MRNVKVTALENQSGSRSANRRTWSRGAQPGRGRRTPVPAPLASPGVAKAAAAAGVRSSGTVAVFLRQWERPGPPELCKR